MGLKNLQKKAFQEYEANQWFTRNKEVLSKYKGEQDHTVKLISQYNLTPGSILEIGSSAGYRLNHLKQKFPSATASGIDLSSDAIAEGKTKYPDINLVVAPADDLSAFPDANFDLVIVGFVFYVVDRAILFKMIKEIDRVLSDKGVLMITDFFAAKPFRNKYHHITEFEAFSFKQQYENIFLASGMYQLLHKLTFNHDDHSVDAEDTYFNKCSLTVLKKDVYASF